jgi:D-lactate dehydrogenase (cytochrome)
MIEKNDLDIIDPYLSDASNYKGFADKVIIPESIPELQKAISDNYKSETPMTISGGGTGLTGGRAPRGGVVISTEKLNKIYDIDHNKKTVRVECGVIIENLIELLDENNLLYPPDPTEANSAIGGNAANNASGAKTFKYGPTRNYVNAAKIILPDGDIFVARRGEYTARGNKLTIETQSGRRINIDLPDIHMPGTKHAAGYYIKPEMDALDLFIGSEGTLGVFAELELQLVEKPENVLGGIAFFDSYEALFEFTADLRNISKNNNLIDYKENSNIAARLIELYDASALELIGKSYPQLPGIAAAAVWFEQEYSEEYEDNILEKWVDFIADYTRLADSTWVAMSEPEHEEFRRFRHSIPSEVNEINTKRKQKKIGTDIAVPDRYIYDLYDYVLEKIHASGLDYAIWGHIGNSHIHANVFAGKEEETRGYEFYDQCIDKALELGGTVSAEHGIGKIKKKYLEKMYSSEGIEKMRRIRRIFDPENMLGRGNLFD